MYNTSNLAKYRSSANTNTTNVLSISKKPNQANNPNILKNQLNKLRESSPSTPNKVHQNSVSYQNILQKIAHTTKKPENTTDLKQLYKSNPKTHTLNGQTAIRNEEDRDSRKTPSRNTFLDKNGNQDSKPKIAQQNKIVLERPYSSSKSRRPISSNFASSKGYKSPVINSATPANDAQKINNSNEEVEKNKRYNLKTSDRSTNPVPIVLESKRRSSPEIQSKRCLSNSKFSNKDMALDFGSDINSKPFENIVMPMTTVNSTTNKNFSSGLRSTKTRRHSQLENSLGFSTRNPPGQLFATKARSSTRAPENKSNNIPVAATKESLHQAPQKLDSSKPQRQNFTVNNFPQYKSKNLRDNHSAAQEQPTIETKRSSKRSLTSRNTGGQFGKENNDVEISNYLKENLITRTPADQDEGTNSILAILPEELTQTPNLHESSAIEKTNSSQAPQTLQNVSWSRRKTIEDKLSPTHDARDLTNFPKYKRSQSENPHNIPMIKQELQFEYKHDTRKLMSPSEALSKEIQKQISDLKAKNVQSSKSAVKIKTRKEDGQSIDEREIKKPENVSPARIGIYDLISKNIQTTIKNRIKEEPNSKTPSSKTPSQDISILSISSEEREAKKAIFKRDYLVGKEIGQGAYAAVRTGLHKPTNTNVAIKIYEKVKIADPMRKKSVRREIKVMERMNHMNVIRIFDIFETRKYVSIVMEYVDGKSLYSLVKSQPHRRLKESHAFIIFKQLMEGINYCHDRCITHRDIKLENVLITRAGIVKIIDFGFTTCIPNEKRVKLFCGTPCYMAPEIVTKQEYCGPPVDIWASGILLYVLLCGTFPFKGDNNQELFKAIAKGEFIIPDHVPNVLVILIRRMLNADPDKRPTAKEVLADPWFIYQTVLQNKKSAAKHRRSLSAEKTRTDRFENISDNLYSSTKNQHIHNWLSNSGKLVKEDEMNIVDEMQFDKFKGLDNNQGVLDLKLFQTNPQSVSHGKRSKTTIISRPKTTRFIFDEDSELSKNDFRRSNEKMFEDIKSTVNGILEQKDTYDDQKVKRRPFNEAEIWNTGDYQSQKSGKKTHDKYSILNKTIGLSKNYDNRDVSPNKPYEPKFIKSLVKMGYTEGEIINGLKDKNAVISTVYNWLVESKVVSKGSVSIGSISSDTVTSNDNSYNMSSPTPHLKKRRTPSSQFTKQTPSTNVSTELKNMNYLASSNVFKVNTILNRDNAPLHNRWVGNNGFNS